MMKLLKSFRCAMQGIWLAVSTQRNMKIHLVITACVILGAVFFKFNRLEWLILFLMILMVLMGELFNTAIEKVVDLVSPDYHQLAGQAKDLAAGAVFLPAMGAVVVGIFLFGPHIWQLLVLLLNG